MSKKKKSYNNGSGGGDAKSSIKSSNKTTSHSKITTITVSSALAIILFIICVVVILLSPNNANINSNPQQTSTRTEKKDAFLNWFVNNGGTFHPIIWLHDDTVNVTIEEFPEYGGWGLALPIPPKSNSITIMADQCHQPSSSSEEEEDDDSIKEQRQCPALPNPKPPIIRHLDPLFTVPSKIIITVQSILEMYAYPKTSSRYLPNFYSTVNKVLTTGNNGRSSSTGLAKRGMTLADQNVVIGMYLMVEECQHHHTTLFNTNTNKNENENGSYWGEYLDVLPQYTIPRLDTFNDEAYASLKDVHLERSGRSSKRRLEEMYNGIISASGGETLSLRSVVQDMIRQRVSNERFDIPESCISFDKFHRFVGIVSSRGMVLKGRVQ